MKVLTIFESLGEGVISLPATLWDGIKRTGDDIGLGGIKTFEEAWGQNIRLYHLLVKAGKFAANDYNNPLVQAIEIILKNYYETMPQSAKKVLIRKAGTVAIPHLSGRMAMSYFLAHLVARSLAKRIARTKIAKTIIKTSVKGVGLLLTIQGVIYTAGKASERLKANYPGIYTEMKVRDLDMLYFLIEKPMSRYLNAIRYSKLHNHLYLSQIKRQYCV